MMQGSYRSRKSEGDVMNVVAAIGSTCLGIVVLCISWYFVRRFNSFTPQTLSAVISIILGGVVAGFLSEDKSVWWFYPIGLFIGLIGYVIASYMATRDEGLSFKDRMGYLTHKKE